MCKHFLVSFSFSNSGNKIKLPEVETDPVIVWKR